MIRIVKEDINFDFIGKRSIAAVMSAIFVTLGLGLFLFSQPNYGIDFKGGTDIILSFQEKVDIGQVREAAKKIGFADATVNTFGNTGTQFMVQTAAVSVVDQAIIDGLKPLLESVGTLQKSTWSPDQPDRMDLVYDGDPKGTAATGEGDAEADPAVVAIQTALAPSGLASVEVTRVGVQGESRFVLRFQDLQQKVEIGFAESFPTQFDRKTGLERLETVGPRVGKQLKEDGLLSLLLALVFILVYVAFRFDIRYAPGAVAALAHDVVVCVGALMVIDLIPGVTYEINLPTIAALLTIVGYSLNDTVVVFDRIRENLIEVGDANTEAVVNRSLNETLSRTLITSITTLLAVACIVVLGGGLIRDFGIALIIGIVVGTYSSIFIASPVMIIMDKQLKARRAFKLSQQQATAE